MPEDIRSFAGMARRPGGWDLVRGPPLVRLISRTVGRGTMEEGSAEKGHVTVVCPAYPNGGQECKLLRTLDVVRGLYNHLLAESIADVVEGDRFPTPWR